MLSESELTGDTLAQAVNRAARLPRPAADLVDLDGARRSAELIMQWCS
jgi:predicted glycosyltransferase